MPQTEAEAHGLDRESFLAKLQHISCQQAHAQSSELGKADPGKCGSTCHKSAGNWSLVLTSLHRMTHLDKGKDFVLANPGTWSVERQVWVIKEGRRMDCKIQLKMK